MTQPDAQNARFSGISCEKCGITLSNSSTAEIHRLEAHTPKGVKDYYNALALNNWKKRNPILKTSYYEWVDE